MSELTVQLVACGVGAVLGSYVTTQWLAYRTRTIRRARHKALEDIANHKWDTNEHCVSCQQNDALIITRIALRGLAGE